jgi:hypothetical protein
LYAGSKDVIKVSLTARLQAKGQLKCIFLSAGADLELASSCNIPALDHAQDGGESEIAELLIEASAIESVDEEGLRQLVEIWDHGA